MENNQPSNSSTYNHQDSRLENDDAGAYASSSIQSPKEKGQAEEYLRLLPNDCLKSNSTSLVESDESLLGGGSIMPNELVPTTNRHPPSPKRGNSATAQENRPLSPTVGHKPASPSPRECDQCPFTIPPPGCDHVKVRRKRRKTGYRSPEPRHPDDPEVLVDGRWTPPSVIISSDEDEDDDVVIIDRENEQVIVIDSDDDEENPDVIFIPDPSPPPPSSTTAADLPNEIWAKIFRFLTPAEQVIGVSGVSQRFRDLTFATAFGQADFGRDLMQWYSKRPSQAFLRQISTPPRAHHFVLSLPFVDYYVGPTYSEFCLAEDWPVGWKSGLLNALWMDRRAIEDVIQALPDVHSLKIHHYALDACDEGKTRRDFLQLYAKATEMTKETLQSLDLHLGRLCRCPVREHPLFDTKSIITSPNSDWRSEAWQEVLDNVSVDLKSLTLHNLTHVTAFRALTRLKKLERFHLMDCSHFMDADLVFLEKELILRGGLRALKELSFRRLNGKKIRPETIIAFFAAYPEWSERLDSLDLYITDVSRFDISPAFQYLRVTKLVLDVPHIRTHSTTHHFLSHLPRLTKLHLRLANIFLPGTSREQAAGFLQGLEELHLLDQHPIFCDVVATVLRFCRRTLKNVSIAAPLMNPRPIPHQRAQDFRLTHLETAEGGEVLWHNVPSANFEGLQTLIYRQKGVGERRHDRPAKCLSFIFRLVEASWTTLRHLESEAICPIGWLSAKVGNCRRLETLRFRSAAAVIDMKHFLTHVNAAFPVESYGGRLIDELSKYPFMEDFEISMERENKIYDPLKRVRVTYHLRKNGMGQVMRFLVTTNKKKKYFQLYRSDVIKNEVPKLIGNGTIEPNEDL